MKAAKKIIILLTEKYSEFWQKRGNNNKAFSPKQVVVGYLIVCKYRVATRVLPYCMLRHLKIFKLFTYR